MHVREYSLSLWINLIFVLLGPVFNQNVDINSIGQNLKLEYTVLEHRPTTPPGYIGRIVLTNTGTTTIPAQGWSIHFCHEALMEPGSYNFVTKQYPPQLVVRDRNFLLQHTKGCMFRLQPYSGVNTTFPGLEPGQMATINFMADQTAVSKYNIYPNWYLTDSMNRTSLIRNTASADRSFVIPSGSPSASMRSPADVPPMTPWSRYREPEIRLDAPEKACIIPTPTFYSDEGRSMKIGDNWEIYVDTTADNAFRDLSKVTNLIASGLGVQPVTRQMRNNIIGLYSSRTPSVAEPRRNYTIRVEDSRVGIFAETDEGLFHGVQTLMSMRNSDGSIPIAIIQDEPRMSYRGFRIDVASKFFDKTTIKKIVDAMAYYKMNKLKLCMTGNEGWRIEIPDYPELTQIGSRRCHDEDEKTCLFSQYGSEPNGQPQFFSATDYQEIVKYAGDRFIQLIPCINMAGQARAAIVAMEARRIARNLANATLQDPNLVDYAAPDHLNPNHLFHYHDANLARFDPRFVPCRYKNTGINPCLQFTYDFFETIITRLKRYHQQAGYDLETIDIGGDDTTYGAWYASSPACQAKIIRENSTDEIDKEMHLKVSYTTEIARLADKHDIDISGVDDYFTAFPSRIDTRTGPSVPFNTTRYGINGDIYAVSGKNYLAYALRPSHLANAGYSVVLSPDDYFSFEHASEPDSEDFGDQNAIRFIDMFRVFTYLPDKRCCNYNPDPVLHRPMSPNGCLHPEHDFCQEIDNDALGSVVGMEAKVATNKIMNEEQLFGAIFPRLAVFAERAWHKAPWEDSYVPPTQMNTPLFDIESQQQDWNRFKRCLAVKELDRLDKLNIKYKIPPPGVQVNVTNVRYDTQLLTSVEHPGSLITQVKKNGIWTDLPEQSNIEEFKDATELEFRTRNKANTRFSRVVKVDMEEYRFRGLQMVAEQLSAEGSRNRMNGTNGPGPMPMPPMMPPPMLPPPGINPMMFQAGGMPSMPGMPPGAVNPAMMQGGMNPMMQTPGMNPAMMQANMGRGPIGTQTMMNQIVGGTPQQAGVAGQQSVLQRNQNGQLVRTVINQQGLAGNMRMPVQPNANIATQAQINGQPVQGTVIRQGGLVSRTQSVPNGVNTQQTIQTFQGQIPNTATRQVMQMQHVGAQGQGQIGANPRIAPNTQMNMQAFPAQRIPVQPQNGQNLNFRAMNVAG